ncbi:MAG: HAD family hydrolase [Thermoplasmata archaeon]|nr:HAD family hydrolase [Thermoplasmata archaeon]
MVERPADAVPPWVFLIDVDDTLLDNDRFETDLRTFLVDHLGDSPARRYWEIVEELRTRLGFVDFLGAVERLRIEYPGLPGLPQIAPFLLGYRFRDRLYPGAIDALRALARFGRTVILSDGDAVFQPMKILHAGIGALVDGRVLVFVHKEASLDEVTRRFPADRYVLIDDKLRILTAVKSLWGQRVVTIEPLQGHYALDPVVQSSFPPPDIALDSIGDLVESRRWPWVT